ncbi:MAG: UPF0280 family protein [Desulfurivibrionaceae bacterium]
MAKTPKSPLSYINRDYRNRIDADGLISTFVRVSQTDLQILADRDIKESATHLVIQYRSQLENYIARNPLFLTALEPLPWDRLAPPIVKDMLAAADKAGVGPMAAVAGAISGFVGRDLLADEGCSEIIVENGGDIYLKRSRSSCVNIYAGTSVLSNRIGIKIAREGMPIGICTSSGTIGHSLSLGQADSVTVLAPDISLADAAATRIGNEIRRVGDLEKGLSLGKSIPGLTGVVIVMDENLGAWGDIEIIRLPQG